MSINLQLQERHALLLTVALGLLVIDSNKRIETGESTMLRGMSVTPAEAITLIGLIRNALLDSKGAPTADPEILTNREKFLLGGALGAMFSQMDAVAITDAAAEKVGQIKLELTRAAEKLSLMEGFAPGAVDFLKDLN
jgi:hypothetical protein